MLFLRVFWTFLKNAAKELAENRYLDRTNHYLQLLYWSSGPKNYGFRAKVRQSLFLGPCNMNDIMQRNTREDRQTILYNFSIDTKA